MKILKSGSKVFIFSFLAFFLVTMRLQGQGAIAVEYVLNNYQGRGFLVITDSVSYWRATYDTTVPKEDKIEIIQSEAAMFVVKKMKENFIYTTQMSIFRVNYVIDSLHNMKWEFAKGTREILGYSCKSAKTTFRGRNYVAYYTEKIPVSNGPWKFGGLPGLILFVHSDDGEFIFSAKGVISNFKEKIKPIDIDTHKFIPMREFEVLFKSIVDSHVASQKAKMKQGEGGGLHIKALEIIYPAVQTGKGIEW
jgi:GLPGLI family protein